jgi:hypothetical protein
MTNLTITIGFTLCLGVSSTLQATAQTVIVEDIKWTDSIRSDGNFNTVYQDQADVESLFVWIKTRCDSTGFSRFQRSKKLPIGFRWYHRTGLNWNFDTLSYPDDSVMVSDDTMSALDSMLTSKGYIMRNTWARMPNLSRGVWKVSVVLLPENVAIKETKIRIE